MSAAGKATFRWGKAWLSGKVSREIVAWDLDSVVSALEAAEQEAKKGFWVVGFVAYEAAPAFDPALEVHGPVEGLPLAWFGVLGGVEPTQIIPENKSYRSYKTYKTYQESVERIRAAIGDGRLYQANFTFPLALDSGLEPWPLFAQLAIAHQASYAVFIEHENWAVMSASPELFLERKGTTWRSKPMKGTRSRGRFAAEDEALETELRESEKDRAENLMIVDMVRNDLGRIARPGSVQAGPLFEIEKYPNVLQMTSTVTCESSASLVEAFRAAFPPASVTGAPKVEAMRVICEEEAGPRGVYCGAVGYLEPGGDATFNVAIRTAIQVSGETRYSVGSGIVWDSDPDAELRECEQKATILQTPADFALFETLLWDEGFQDLDLHLERIKASAERFGFELGDLEGVLGGFYSSGCEVVRVVLSREGKVAVEPRAVQSWLEPKFAFCRTTVDSRDPFLFHKSTQRSAYDLALQEVGLCHLPILQNELGHATESAIGSLAFFLDGRWLTPPLSDGVFPGIERAKLLAQGKIHEASVPKDRIEKERPKIAIFNSVRGWAEGELHSEIPWRE